MIISEDNSYEYLKQVAANYKSEKLQDLCNHNKDIHITLDNELFFLNKELLTKAKEINAEERVIMEAAGKIPSMVANLRLKSDDKIKLVQNGSIKKCKNIICLTNLNGRLIISMNDGQSSEIVLITKKK